MSFHMAGNGEKQVVFKYVTAVTVMAATLLKVNISDRLVPSLTNYISFNLIFELFVIDHTPLVS